MKFVLIAVLALAVLASAAPVAAEDLGKKRSLLWEPVEWSKSGISYNGNPIDIISTVVFTHTWSGRTIKTEMYSDGTDKWKLRFTGTLVGRWLFKTQSDMPALNDLTGEVRVGPNPGKAGFMTNYGGKWGRLGVDEAFVPQFVMYDDPFEIMQHPKQIDEDIRVFFAEHGFNGFHTSVSCRWFDITQPASDKINSTDPNPDPRTFEMLELLITKTRNAGGVVHIWAWGDDQRKMTVVRWGINGKVDKRLQRYICARLGPLPGWSMGYGFDLQEWVKKEDMAAWHKYMQEHLGWFHFLGARAPELETIYSGLDYSSYQKWRPDYDTYVQAIEKLSPGKPVFFEDRFRVRKDVYPEKDYSLEMTRKGLWHSTMAGGAANIWGYWLTDTGRGASGPYPNKDQILTYSKFFRNRFRKEMVRDNSVTDGVCLTITARKKTKAGGETTAPLVNTHYVFYKENASSVKTDMSGMGERRPGIVIDTNKPYQEINMGLLDPVDQTWQAPYESDWAIAVGDFGSRK